MKMTNSARLPRKRYLASAKPAMQASATAPTTAGTVMSTLLRMNWAMRVSANTAA